MTALPSDDEDISGSGESALKISWTSPLNVTDVISTTTGTENPNRHTSVTILAIVAVVAVLTLIVFAAVTFRYLFVHQGSYKVHEFKTDAKTKENRSEETKLNNVYETSPSREWLI